MTPLLIEKMKIIFLILLLVNSNCINSQNPEQNPDTDYTFCKIALNSLLENHPIILHSRTKRIIEPNYTPTIIRLAHNTTIELHCPNSNILIAGKRIGEQLDARCSSKKEFSSDEGIIVLEKIKCVTKILSSVRETNRSCSTNGKVLEVGFALKDERFLIQYLLCFDFANMIAVANYHKMSRWSACNRSPSFCYLETSFENDHIPYEKIYLKRYQQAHINSLLNLPSNSKSIVNNEVFLRHCFFAAKPSFMYTFQQVAVSKYINTFPQWWNLQFYNWHKIQNFAMSYTHKEQVDLDVFTGTYGVLKMLDREQNVNKTIYLYTDEKTRAIPVALLHWRVLYDGVNKRGIAFVALNNPYFRGNFSSLLLCPDVSFQLGHLWKIRYTHSYNYRYGFMYACRIEDIRKAIPDIPDMEVVSLFKLYR